MGWLCVPKGKIERMIIVLEIIKDWVCTKERVCF